MEKMEKKVTVKTMVYSLLILIAAFLVVIGVLIYGFGSNSGLVKKVTSVVPFPAAIIGASNFISYGELDADLDAVRNFYEKQDFSSTGIRIDFTTADGQKRLMIKKKNLLNKLIENRIIQILANKSGIKITSDLINQEVDRKIAEYGSQQDVLDNIQRLYGWDMGTFKERIVKPDMYAEALQKKFETEDESRKNAKAKIAQALSDLSANKDFSEVAKKYSDGESAQNGGEVGWFRPDQMLAEISSVAFSLQKGQRSDIISSSLGYHIILVEDTRIEDGINQVKIRQIFVRARSFADWLLEQEKQMNVRIPLRDFYWDKQNQDVEFTSSDLKDFEANLDKNSPGDISVLF